MNVVLNAGFWNNLYKKNDTGWDAKSITSPLKNYFDQLKDSSIKILIPGGGNSYEAEYLFKKGFENVFVLDYAEAPLKNLSKRCKKIPKQNLIHQNFFKHKGQYDLIVEQTFFCALDPKLRSEYAKHMHKLLKPNGKLVGLLFTDKLTKNGPPFGGSIKEYNKYFKPYFKINIFDKCYNSIKPRAGRELFINLSKK
jgi:SAM-dependent methyltransferase